MQTEAAALLEKVSEMDDLVVQFDDGDADKRLIEAWKCARHYGLACATAQFVHVFVKRQCCQFHAFAQGQVGVKAGS